MGVLKEYKFLGVSINSRLNLMANINAMYKRGMTQVFLFQLSLYAARCWRCSTGVLRPVHCSSDSDRPNKLIKKVGSIMGLKLDCVEKALDTEEMFFLLYLLYSIFILSLHFGLCCLLQCIFMLL